MDANRKKFRAVPDNKLDQTILEEFCEYGERLKERRREACQQRCNRYCVMIVDNNGRTKVIEACV